MTNDQIPNPKSQIRNPKPETRTEPGRSVRNQITVALTGQPNVGKSTVFNLLTGLSQHVGNWPGKTIEQKTGTYHHNGITVQIVDLPGTYSLTANSLEEQIARDYIIKEKPDVVVAIDSVIDLKLDALGVMISQFAEGGANGNASLYPADPAGQQQRQSKSWGR